MLDISVFSGRKPNLQRDFIAQPYGDGYKITGFRGNGDVIIIPERFRGKPVKAVCTFVDETLRRSGSIFQIHIPTSVEEIEPTWSQRPEWGENICIDPANPHFTVQDGLLFNRDKSAVILVCDDSLQEIRLPDETEHIAAHAFRSAKNLRSVHLGKGVKTIGDRALDEDENLEQISVDEENDSFASMDGFLYTKDRKTLLAAPIRTPCKTYEVPPETVNISERACYGNQGIRRLIAKHPMNSIGNYAFGYSNGLKSVELAEVDTIGEDAFCTGEALAKLTADKVRGIAERAFCCCEKLRNVQIHSASEIGDGAFSDCYRLSNVQIYSASVIGNGAFSGCHSLSNVQIHSASVIGNRAFRGDAALTAIELPEDLRSIGESAFEGTGLQKVLIPRSVETVGESAFFQTGEGLSAEVYDTLISSPGKIAYGWDDTYGNKLWTCRQHRITVKRAADDTVLYTIYMGRSSGTASKYREAVNNGWRGAAFDFPALDAVFAELREPDEKAEVALLRLKYPVDLPDATKKMYLDYLRRSAKRLLIRFTEEGDIEKAAFLDRLGVLKAETVDAAIEACEAEKQPSMMFFLLERKNRFGDTAKKKDRTLSLSLSMRPAAEKPDWVAHREKKDRVLRYRGKDTEVVFPTEVKGTAITGIADAMARLPENYLPITSVVIPEGYMVLGDNAFNGCVNLRTVKLPSTLTKIGKNCFRNCGALTHIDIPPSVSEIGDRAFSGTGIRTYELFSDVQIGDSGIGGAETLIAHGNRTGHFTNNHYISHALEYIYSDGEVAGIHGSRFLVMPLSYLSLGLKELFYNLPSGFLRGKTFCCRGKMKVLPQEEVFSTRPTFWDFVRRMGGTCTAKLTAETDILVVYEIDPADRTIQRAIANGTTVLTEYDFLVKVLHREPF